MKPEEIHPEQNNSPIRKRCLFFPGRSDLVRAKNGETLFDLVLTIFIQILVFECVGRTELQALK